MIAARKGGERANQEQPAARPSVRSAIAAALLLLSLLLAVAGQFVLQEQGQVTAAVFAFAASALLFLLSVSRSPLWQPRRESPSTAAPRLLVTTWPWRLLFALNSLLLAWLAFAGFAQNSLSGGFWFWLGALFYFLLACSARPAGGIRLPGRRLLLALAAITAVGIFFRLYRLPSVPAEMTSDHAEKLLDVYDVLQGHRPLFFERNTGREMVQFYLTAALIRLTPLTVGYLALKLGTALVGIVTVPLTYFLGREFYGRAAGLLAASFLAVSHWHVAITRVGLRFPFTAAFTVPALYFLLRALRYNRRNDWLAAGLVLGVGLHTYTAMRIVPLLFVLLVLLKAAADLWLRVRHREPGEATAWQRTFWVNALLGGAASLLVFLPLLRYWWERPQLFWYRAASRAAELPLPPAELWRRFWLNWHDALLMFNYKGDVVPANTIPWSPALGLVTGGLFVLGLLYLLYRLLRLHERQALYLLVAFLVLLLPSVLSLSYPQENPSVVRTGGAAPLVMIIATLPLVAAGRQLLALPARLGRALLLLLVSSLLLLSTVDNFNWYFVRYDQHVLRSSWNTSEMGAVVQEWLVEEGGRLEDVYHIPYPHWVDTRNIAINAGDIRWHNSVPDLDEIEGHAAAPAPKLYLLHPDHRLARQMLHAVYPEGQLKRYNSSRPGKDFLIFYTP